MYNKNIDRERKSISTKLVNLRIDFAFKQLFGTKGNEEVLKKKSNSG
ncbi:hypothetical protein MC28_G015 (plasmid) [Bacillus thuringiensis MC28]|nr:hypothetical protein MC28_G015 [Bacillus thuringiensis MC28]